MRIQLSTSLFAPIALLAVLSCASCSTSRVHFELRSEPAGADVYSLENEKLGSTPLTLSPEQLEKVSKNDRISVRLEAPGYIPANFYFDPHQENTHQIKLIKLDADYFSTRFMQEYSAQANQMARSLLQIQALVMARKLDDAEKAIQSFQAVYPNIAAAYAFLGNIQLLRGDKKKARAYLMQGLAIDPHDPVISRALGRYPAQNEGGP